MIKQLLPAIRSTLLLAALTGLIFPLVITGIAQVLFPAQANGSLVRNQSGAVIGSTLIAQKFAAPQYFHPRPSAAGSGYAGEASSGSNLGPTSDKLINGTKDFPGVKQLAVAYRVENNLPADMLIPVDAVTRSASGLDPHISLTNALMQSHRVATARHLGDEQVQQLIRSHLATPDLGILGVPRVNVLQLNLALDSRDK